VFLYFYQFVGKDLTGIIQFKSVVLGGLLLNLLILGGCGQLATKTSPEQQTSSPKTVSDDSTQARASQDELNLSSIDLSPEDMYRVLLAEMLVVKGDVHSGYKVMFDVATRTRSPQLAERTFKLSMATYDLKAIAQQRLCGERFLRNSLWRGRLPILCKLVMARFRKPCQAGIVFKHYRQMI